MPAPITAMVVWVGGTEPPLLVIGKLYDPSRGLDLSTFPVISHGSQLLAPLLAPATSDAPIAAAPRDAGTPAKRSRAPFQTMVGSTRRLAPGTWRLGLDALRHAEDCRPLTDVCRSTRVYRGHWIEQLCIFR